jgi:tetratricopeptide (TPR) repeat protein
MALAYLVDDFPERAAEADSLYRQGVEMRRRTLGIDHPFYASALGDYAVFLTEAGRAQEALQVARQHYDLVLGIYGPEHPRTAEVMITYARALARAGQKAEAVELARQSVELRLVRLGRVHNSTAIGMSHLAQLLYENGEREEALGLMDESIAILRITSGGAETGLVALTYAELARMQLDTRMYSEAEQSLHHALRIYEQSRIPPAHKDHQLVLRILTELYDATGKPEQASRYRALLRN